MAHCEITPEWAYVAIDKSGFLESVCCSLSDDLPNWQIEMENLGCRIELWERGAAKRVLFTVIDRPHFMFLA